MNIEQIMALVDRYVDASVALETENEQHGTLRRSSINEMMEARAALEAALTEKQEPQTFDEWTSDYVRDNLHKLKPKQDVSLQALLGEDITKPLVTTIATSLHEAKQGPWCKEMNRCESKCDDCPDPAPVAKQEPVAWRLYKGGELYALKHEKEDRGELYTWEPLYLHPAPVNQEPVAWRYVPSEVWGSHVVTDDPEKAKLATGCGISVTPLYTNQAQEAKHSPVAYHYSYVNVFGCTVWNVATQASPDAIEVRPLYTHPAPVNQQLLEALKKLVSVTKHLNPCPGTIEEARAAITAAEGKV